MRVLDIITEAHRSLGLLDGSEVVAGEDSAADIKALNSLLASEVADPLFMPAYTFEEIPVVQGVTDRIIITEADHIPPAEGIPYNEVYYESVRPHLVSQIRYVSGNENYDVRLVDSRTFFNRSLAKSVSRYPSMAWYHRTFNIGTLRFNNIFPTDKVWVFGMWSRLNFESLTDLWSVPGEYTEYIVSSLAIRLAPSYGINPSAILFQIKREAKKLLNALSRPVAPDAELDSAAVNSGVGAKYRGFYGSHGFWG